jgi:tetraacyldisaccharide 4'-kinase
MRRILLPFAAGYRTGLALRQIAYRSGLFKMRRLNRPVISVGNLTVGGTGKTPLVMFIAERLLDRGWTPSILTRGYRRSAGGMVTLAPQTNRRADPRETGDEASLLAAALPKVPIVIGSNRHRAGRMAEERYTVDVHLLDDGFQHWALFRQVDVVTLDVTQDFASGRLLPAGNFREPRSALRRADIVVLTRCDLADPSRHLQMVAELNPGAEVFESTLALRGWMNALDGSAVEHDTMASQRALAFCGIGNPRAFFSSLRQWGIQVAAEVPFRDHYRYGAGDLHRLEGRARAAGAGMLVTTEKDLANFPRAWKPALPVVVAVTRVEMPESDAFIDSLVRRVHSVRVSG